MSTDSGDSGRLAARYPSLASQSATVTATSATSTAPTGDAERLAKRYPSHAAAAPAEATATSAAERVQAERVAKRYPSVAGETAPHTAAELELEAPDGIAATDPIFTDFRKVAGELGLDKDKAGKLLELQQRSVAAHRQAWDAQVDGWEKALSTDQEIGGANLEQSLDAARGLVKEFGTPELHALDQYGLGSHPEFIRLLTRVGRALDDERRGR